MYNVLKYKEKTASNQLVAKNTELESASARIGTNCSECGKPITAADLEEVVASIKAQIIAIQIDYVKYRDICSKAAPKLDEYSEKVSTADLAIAECRKAEKAISALRESLAKAEAVEETVRHLEGQVKSLKDRKATEAAAESPWKTLIEKETKAVGETATKIVNIEKVVAEKQEEIQYAEYWETAFGYSGIPSFILDSLTPFLNERANHHSSTVTGGEIEIEFATVSKTKKGELKDKFAINITHKNGAKSYKGSSGGEQQRANVCIAQSIQDLVRSFGRNTLSYCSYDEPFESLDQEGIANVVEMLNEIAREIGTVLVVTHSDELKAMFDNAITVTKKKDGYSHIAA
jgi:DNA repair exonuclease SbcCD ATPase subunit